jgi:hypothetical protein
MRAGEQLYSRLARNEEEITVEIFREVESLIKFSVPWATRVTGRYLSAPKVRQSRFTPFSHLLHCLLEIILHYETCKILKYKLYCSSPFEVMLWHRNLTQIETINILTTEENDRI